MFNKLRSSLLFYSISITLVTLLIAIFVSLNTFKELRNKNIRETLYNKLQIVVDNIDMKLKLVDSNIEWFTMNDEINALIKTPDNLTDNLKFKSITAHAIIENSIYTSGLFPFINKILIGNTNGYFIQTGIIKGRSSDGNIALKKLKNVNNTLVLGPFEESEEKLIYAKHRVILDLSNYSYLGDIFVTLNTEIFTKYLNWGNKNTRFYLGLKDKIYNLSKNSVLLSTELNAQKIYDYLDSIEKMSISKEPRIPALDIIIDGEKSSLLIYKGASTDFFIAQLEPEMKLDWQGYIFLRFLFFVMFIVFFLIFSIALIIDKTINIPILHIGKKIQNIADGDFSIDKTIEYNNEIGLIGRGINLMVGRIEKLIKKRIQDEKIKKDLEFRVLQSQINPHFLYNTLNSIKWMAIAQKTTGIPEMVNSLAILLKHISKGTEKIIPLKEELFLVEQYCNIQSFRSGGIVDTNITFESPELEQCKIVKFSLQPLIENAISHGIEPKKIPGKIDITITRNSPADVMIEIKDNGIGIPKEKLLNIFSYHDGTTQSFNHIGLNNVNERLKSSFGDKYGLTIKSVYKEFTIVNVLIPFYGELLDV